MLLSIMLPCLATRPWERTVRTLMTQARGYADVEILYDVDRGALPSGEKRNRLMQRAQGRYVAFADDDDDFDPLYVSALRDACNADSAVDVVTFNMAVQNAYTRRREVWRLGLHTDARDTGLMAANHLCAWRKDIAARVAWSPLLGYADDQLWYQPINAAALAKTTIHIDRALYRYQFDPRVTANQHKRRVAFARQYVGAGLRCFWTAENEILVETHAATPLDSTQVVCRDRHNSVRVYDTADLSLFHTITID